MKNKKALKKKIRGCVTGVTFIAAADNVLLTLISHFGFTGISQLFFQIVGFLILFIPGIFLYVSRYLNREDGAIIEVTQNAEAQKNALAQEIDEREERYRLLVKNLPVGILTCDTKGNIITVNEAAVKLLGSTSIEATKAINAFTFPNLVESGISQSLKKCLETGQVFRGEAAYTSKWGKKLDLQLHFAPLHDSSGRITRIQGIIQDFTEDKKTRDQLQTYYYVIEHTPVGVMISDKDGLIEYLNPQYSRITGYQPEDLVAQKVPFLYDREGIVRADYKDVLEIVSSGDVWKRERYNRKKNGQGYWEKTSIAPVLGESGEISHYVTIKEDISRRKEDEEKAAYLAYHDVLTGLANRCLFYDRLKMAVANAERYQTWLAVMYLDLDGFKEINDTFGHDVGDQLLVAVAGELKAMTRKSDTVARMGGDELTLLIPDVKNKRDVEKIAQKILTAVQKPWTDKKLSITTSIGIAYYPHDGKTPEQLLKNADKAMYRAKKMGKNTFVKNEAV